MNAAAAPRTARFYTAARRHPWVMGKLADWRLPLGPYNAAQIGLAVVGGFVLVKTISLWSVLGPIPVAAWLVGIWLLRRPKIGGRHPMSAAMGMVALFVQPAGGRIGQRAARDPRPRRLGGGFTFEDFTPFTRPTAAAPTPPSERADPGRRSTRPPQAHHPRTQARRTPQTPVPAAPAARVAPAAALLAQAQLRAQNTTKGGW